jgi:hypothetical protein
MTAIHNDRRRSLRLFAAPQGKRVGEHLRGARIKAVCGDRDAAAGRLDDGARVAATLGLPRLRAHVDNERTSQHNAPNAEWCATFSTAGHELSRCWPSCAPTYTAIGGIRHGRRFRPPSSTTF